MPTSSLLSAFAEEPAAWGEIDPRSGYERVRAETSRPILERLGFRRVAEHRILEDPATC